MKKILLFGAGKSATFLIEYLLRNAGSENWTLIVVDADLQLAQCKIGDSRFGQAVSFDIHDDDKRRKYINETDVVISLLPPALHYIVARDCVALKKYLLTASYVDDRIRDLAPQIEENGLLFLCEMGLDPGIDHMSAMKMFDEIHGMNGKITSFKSHCGGLVAPESDNNPWRYKISWNPRSVVTAGKSGGHYKDKGKEIHIAYEQLFSNDRTITIPGLEQLCWYPNRDSLNYARLYNLEEAETFVRTTLRYPDFMYGWKNVIDLKLTDETPQYHTNGRTLFEVFKEHMDKNGFGEWLEQKLTERFKQSKDLMEHLLKLMEAEQEAEKSASKVDHEFLTVDSKGKLEEIELDEVKNRAANFLAHKMHEANLTLKQLFFLGLDDKDTYVNRGFCSPADVLLFALETKLALQPEDKDMVVMMHEAEYAIEDKFSTVRSSLIVKGENNVRTAMAKTVGLPLGIATKNILNGVIQLKGLHIPTKKQIYLPILKELEEHGIKFHEEVTTA